MFVMNATHCNSNSLMSIRNVPFREKNVRYNRVIVVTEPIVSGRIVVQSCLVKQKKTVLPECSSSSAYRAANDVLNALLLEQ